MKMAYGQWFHQLMKKMEWSFGCDSWSSTFSEMLGSCPNVKRARIEWESFLTSDLANLLSRHGYSTLRELRVELPRTLGGFENQRIGIIDLCFFDHSKDRCWLVDWKTTRGLDPMNEIGLADFFKKLWCYKEAINETLNGEVLPSLYLTSSAKWVTSSEFMKPNLES